MTPLNWLYMLGVWAIIISLNVYCFSRIFMKERSKKKEED